MNFSTFRFTLDLHKHQSQMSIAVFQYDTAIELSIGITDGGIPYYFADGCRAELYGKKQNGSPIVHDCSIVDNRIIYKFQETTANEIGVTTCQIVIYNANNQTISAPTFIITVGERVVNDDDVFDDDDFEGKFSALDAIIGSENKRIDAETARGIAEIARGNAETARGNAETARGNAETARGIAETARGIAEIARDNAETARGIAEKERDTEEKKRQTLYSHFEEKLNSKMDRFTLGLSYKLSADGTSYICTGKGEATETDIIIPNEYSGLPVTQIGDYCFNDDTEITSITIPNSVEIIGRYTFSRCINLTSVTIGNGVTTIGSHAFGSCSSLTSVTIPDSVTSIGASAFQSCDSLIYVVIPDSVTSIGEFAFYPFSNDVNVTIYCEAESKPSGWDISWSKNISSVVWGAACDLQSLNLKFDKVLDEAKTYTDSSKSEAISEAKTYTDSVKNDLLNGAGDAYDSLKELGDLIDTNEDAIDALREIAVNKVDKTTEQNKIYATDELGKATALEYSTSQTKANSIVQRTETGGILVPETVKDGLGATPKNYVDKWIRSRAEKYTEGLVYDLVEVGETVYYSCAGRGTSINTELIIPRVYHLVFDWNIEGITENAFANDTTLTKIFIHSGITYIGANAFKGCTNLTIYCEAGFKPAGWHSNWNPDGRTVVWGTALDIPEINRKINSKVDSVGLASVVYGTSPSGHDAIYDVVSGTAGAGLAYKANGQMAVVTPTQYFHCSSKGYTDEKDNEVRAYANSLNSAMDERVTELESLTLAYPEITSTDYEKLNPAEVGKYALVKMLGGATERVVSKNEINPEDITWNNKGGGGSLPVTINSDGSITFTVKYEQALGAIASIRMPNAAKYYYLVEGDDSYGSVFDSVNNVLEIDFTLPEDLDSENGYYADEWTWTVKIMLWKAEDSDTFVFEEAPEGTVFEPYFEPYLQDAEVTRIESLGKNRLPSDVYDASNWKNDGAAAYWYKYYLDFLSDGWYCISLKLKEEYSQKTYLYLQKSVDGGQTYSSSEAGYKASGTLTYGYLVTASGLENNPFWFKVDKKAGIVYRLNFNDITQSKLDQIYDIQIERVNLTQEPSASHKPSVYAPATEYTPYQAEPIDTITIPEAVKLKAVNDTCYDYIEFVDDKMLSHKNVEVVDLGSLTWTSTASAKEGHRRYIADFPLAKAPASDTAIANILCTKYTSKSSADIYLANDGIAISASGKVCIFDSLLSTDTLSNFTNAMQGVKMYYELATPIVTDITDLFTEDNSIEVQGGGVLRFVNENEMAVPNTVGYVTRKE